ncbi:MAG: hypothetical protein V4524_02885 [Patescibacteria group bacterium]
MTQKFTLTTPLGIFCCAVFIRHWNDSIDSAKKSLVRTLLTSKEKDHNDQGLATLYHIINDRLHNPHEPVLELDEERLCIITELRRIAMLLEKGPLINFSSGADEDLLIEQALDEVVAYFKSRFACAELTHIMIPNYYRVTDQTQPHTAESAVHESFITTTGRGDGAGDISLALRAAP